MQPAPDAQTVSESSSEPNGDIDLDVDLSRPAVEAPPVPAPRSAPEAQSSDAVPVAPGAALTEREREILAFEQQWWKHAGAKEQAIRDAFDLPATRYYQLLNTLLDNPAALAAAPMLVGRLRRLRSAGARTRRR